MPIYRKKFLAILITLLFLISAVVTTSAVEVKKDDKVSQDVTTEPKILSETITVYRHGLDGLITPISVNINYDDTKDLGDAIIEKCKELFENDVEFKDLKNNSKIKIGLYGLISSKGKGFHYQMKLLGKLTCRYVLFRLGLPRFNSIFVNPIIICRYKNDPQAITKIKSFILGGTKEINGSHTVIAHNFIGFTSWMGRFSFTPFDLLPKSFFGIAKFSFCVG